MGAGVALEAKKRWPDLPKILAHSLKEKGNTVSCLAKRDGKWIIAFPTKTDWKKPSDPFLIEQSCRILKLHWSRQENKPIVAMSRPGCGNGGLKWPEVKPILEKYFQEDEFVVVNNT